MAASIFKISGNSNEQTVKLIKTMTNKIPPGIYSVENRTLQVVSDLGYHLMNSSMNSTVATIGFSLSGIPQLHIRERSAEDVLDDGEIEAFAFKKYHDVEDSRWYEPLQIGAKWARDTIKAALSRTQSGYTREQVEEAMLQMAKYILDCKEGKIENISSGDKCDAIIASLTPSITSVTIGDNNSIVNVKYK